MVDGGCTHLQRVSVQEEWATKCCTNWATLTPINTNMLISDLCIWSTTTEVPKGLTTKGGGDYNVNVNTVTSTAGTVPCDWSFNFQKTKKFLFVLSVNRSLSATSVQTQTLTRHNIENGSMGKTRMTLLEQTMTTRNWNRSASGWGWKIKAQEQTSQNSFIG